MTDAIRDRVYVLLGIEEHVRADIIGVYASPELAESAREAVTDEDRLANHWNAFEIGEWEVEGA